MPGAHAVTNVDIVKNKAIFVIRWLFTWRSVIVSEALNKTRRVTDTGMNLHIHIYIEDIH